MTHTPGPWWHFPFEFGNDENEFVIGYGQYQTIAHVRMGSDDIDGNTLANARLISAAPEMLEHGQFLLDRIDELDFADMPEEFMRDWMGHVEPALSRFRAILAKARGTT